MGGEVLKLWLFIARRKKHQILISVNFVLTTGMNKKLLIRRGLSKAIDEGAYK